MLRIFIGYDHRQPVAYTVLQNSLMRRSSRPLAITPLIINQLPLKRTGLTPFTWSRFLVPYLCNYQGQALFLDVDMLVLGDIAQLFGYVEEEAESVYAPMAVHVVRNAAQFEWASLMFFNCGHEDNLKLTPEYIETAQGLHGIKWTDQIGELPSEWNHIVHYDEPRDDAKLVHYTAGIPVFPQTRGGEYLIEYEDEFKNAISAAPHNVLMGRSRHLDKLKEGMKNV